MKRNWLLGAALLLTLIVVVVLAIPPLFLNAPPIEFYRQKLSGLIGSPNDTQIISVFEHDAPAEMNYRDIKVVGRQDCPLVSGDQAKGITARVFVSLTFTIVNLDASTPGTVSPNLVLRNNSWQMDPNDLNRYIGRCPR